LSKVRLHRASSTARWEVGFELYCSVSRRLLSPYLGRAVNEQEAMDAVTLFGWSRAMTRASAYCGIRTLRELRSCARLRETSHTLAQFRRRCVWAFLTEAEILVYADPVACRRLLLEAVRWWPATALSSSASMLVLRMLAPRTLRQGLKRTKQALEGRKPDGGVEKP